MRQSLELVLLISLLLVCTGFTIGLTYAPCYASLCVEEFLPYETRLHIASFYTILVATALLLLLRAYNYSFRQLSEFYLVRQELPILKKRISVGGLFIAIFLVGLTLATTAFWLQPTVDHWKVRAQSPSLSNIKVQLIVTSIIAHHVDILLGLLLLPVSRNSILGRVFGVHQSTLLYSHKMLSYLTFVAVIAHGVASLVFVATRDAAPKSDPVKELFDVYNPTLTEAEAKARGPWALGVLPTGVILLVLFAAIVITSLPVIRRRNYNFFYYSHIFCLVGILICASIHASTDFYFILPGLLLWVGDLAWRQIRGYSGLSKTVIGKLEAAEAGWYRISLPVAVKQISAGCDDTEKAVTVATHPIQSYYFVFPAISQTQNHAFTSAKVGNEHSGPVFLMQRATGKKQSRLDKEWTWRLGAMVDGNDKMPVAVDVKIRVEGPYAPSVPELWSATNVVCIVGGTGLTGAYSLALWWAENRSHQDHSSFCLVWTVRHDDTARLREWHELEKIVESIDNMRLILQVTSEQGRLDAADVLGKELSERKSLARSSSSLSMDENAVSDYGRKRAWVYISGPEGLLSSVESACIDVQRDLRRGRKQGSNSLAVERLDYYSAKWEV